MLLEREAQLTALSEYAADARAGRGRLVFVSGESGIGKTALVEAFERSVAMRTLHGACDGLFTPRALGPLFDLATEAGGALLEACRAERPREELFSTLLETLAREPTMVVLEDLHWADEATLDLVRHVGRRLRGLPVVMVVTYRDDALSARDPLRVVLGELGTQQNTRRMDLAPLSRSAVDRLAGAAALPGDELFRLTGGNPFFVSEVLRGGLGAVPPSARDAVLARVARLRDPARRTAEAAALLGGRVDLDVLAAVCEARAHDLDELVVSGLLMSGPEGLRFRHELTRLTIATETPVHRASAVHAAALAALVERGADDARLAYHAEGAGDAGAIQRFSRRAAERSAELGAHREAVAQLERALRFTGGLTTTEVAELWMSLSVESGLIDRWDRAQEAIDAALDLWRRNGDPLRVGDALRVRSMSLWRLCREKEATESVREAVRVLSPLGPTPELAIALAKASNFEEELVTVIAEARRAEELARQLDLPDVTSDALNTQACALALRGEAWEPAMREALELARATRSDAQTGRAYANYQSLLAEDRRWDDLDTITAEGLAYCEEHDIATYNYCIRAAGGEAMLLRGRWDEAVALAQPLVDLKASPVNVVTPLCVVGLAHARRGETGAMSALDEAVELADRTGGLGWRVATRVPRAEAELLAGDVAAAREDLLVCHEPGLREEGATAAGAVLLWSRRAGLEAPELDGMTLEPPAELALDGRHLDAAAAWDAQGMPYEAAWALVDDGSPEALRDAVVRFEHLGATAAAKLARRQLRRMGAPGVPSGPRSVSRAHPAGLTGREQEVLCLVVEGLTDEQIADRLVLSVRTVHHHVSAVLSKLGVSSRREATAEARRRGLVAVG